MKTLIIYIFKGVLKFIYFFLKMLPTNNKKVVFISRQSDKINVDFEYIAKLLKKKDKDIKEVFLCKRFEDSDHNYISYFFTILSQMYHLATSKVAVIDSYCIPVCILNHKKTLKVLQIWHSIGKIKKSGYQVLDTPAGKSSKFAKNMCMHKNYDNIVAGGVAFNKFYVEGFNCNESVLLNYGLPRSDKLLNEKDSIRKHVLEEYPELNNGKINIYYAPTFRKYDIPEAIKMIEQFDLDKVNLIVRFHPKQKIDTDTLDKRLFTCNDISAVDLLTVSDYLITDYSSICLDGAVLDVKLLFYVFDYDKYMSENGINLDALKILPTCSSKEIVDLIKIINNDKYDNKAYETFRANYLPETLGKSTELITNKILEYMKN